MPRRLPVCRRRRKILMTDARDAVRGLLGLAQRAGKLLTGTDTALSSLRAGKAKLALLDRGASENTVKKATDACIYYHVPLLFLESGLLGMACGREGRMIGIVTDQGFAGKILSLTAGQNCDCAALHK